MQTLTSALSEPKTDEIADTLALAEGLIVSVALHPVDVLQTSSMSAASVAMVRSDALNITFNR